ncbi:MAG TPA: cytochrome d ubiquinol oxidase subunit II [Terriglobales bacterium]|nr:cytochrome d ubiquinol oxidase subunit II [Terriglobales bacterium]
METVWFLLVAFMLTAYVLLDGFDLGAGIIHLFVARSDDERRMVLRAIGPVWDGNEVWLLAGGGTLFFAFPLLYASSFSGFYLPLNMVLWLLILRAIGIEFRMHLDNQVWRDFFDGLFSLGSLLLAIFLGAALGNVIRGVPLGPDHYFFEPLWTDFRPGPSAGILDWYTVLAGVVSLVALTSHGAAYLALKTDGDLAKRSRQTVRKLWPLLVALTVISCVATIIVRPQTTRNYTEHPIGFVIPVVVATGLVAMLFANRAGNDRRAFLSSCAYLSSMLAGAAYAQYPTLLPSSNPSAPDISIHNAAAGSYSLNYGVIWWSIGMVIAIGYFVFIYRMFRGKVSLHNEGHGY